MFFSGDALPKIKLNTMISMGNSYKYGEILSVHFNCMADLAEICTRVTSLLFWTKISIKVRESSTVTDRAVFWDAPSNLSHLQPQKI